MSRQKNENSHAPFLVFEGLDGSGKSTLIQGLKSALTAHGCSFVQTREPGGTPLAEDIRRLLLRTDGEVPAAPTELLLYAASRAQHVSQVIRPSLAAGKWVLCDRFSASTVAFQSFARKLPRPEVNWLNQFAEQGTHPDLYVLLDLSVEESQRRQNQRSEGSGQVSDRMEREAHEFHEAVRHGYLAQAEENQAGWLVLNALESPAQLLAKVMATLKERGWLAS